MHTPVPPPPPYHLYMPVCLVEFSTESNTGTCWDSSARVSSLVFFGYRLCIVSFWSIYIAAGADES